MKTSDFAYPLPPELIAQHPPARREDARLLVLDRRSGTIEHRLFPDLLGYFHRDDLLILNDVRVIPARLFGKKVPTGGRLEALLLKKDGKRSWSALVRPAGRLRKGAEIDFGEGIRASVLDNQGGGEVLLHFAGQEDISGILDRAGYAPLPPYIKRAPEDYSPALRREDRERYQTVFADAPGAIAAPTAGLHFTKELLERIKQKGVGIAYVTLFVGYGTFQPVKVENLEDHRMQAEYYVIGQETAEEVNHLRQGRGRLWVVGTTSVRALESAAERDGAVSPRSAWTDIFIYPGYRLKLSFSLVTNFHLPGSTLLMLVSALAGRENILRAYAEAVRERYRFYSFGDAMLII